MKIIATLILFFCFAHYVLASDITFDTVVAGKKCQEDERQQLNCTYNVGKSLSIDIVGIGMPDTSVYFMKSDFNGDFYGVYGMQHGCIIIKNKNEIFSMAFVSPRNGKIYRTWRECKDGM
jgi:hypothetical protein